MLLETPSNPDGNSRYTPTSNDVCSILPSYHMYNSIYKLVTVDNDNCSQPPIYSRSNSIIAPSERSSSAPSLFSPVGSRRVLTSDAVDQILADETTVQWQNTVMDNIHELKNLKDTDNSVAKATKITVHFTSNVGEIGVPPVPLDTNIFEHNRGDFLHGYALIENLSAKPIPFDMFYLLFEGTIKMNGKPVKNFLQMFDFSASSNPAHINRLATEYANPYSCPDLQDPVDKTYLSFTDDHVLPGRIYKRFFTFRIPETLLDLTCPHSMNGHVEVPPTLKGLQKVGDVNAIRDFSFAGTDISYGVMARFIGRKSFYKVDEEWIKNFRLPLIVNTKGDEYIILQECTKHIRIVQRSEPLNETTDMAMAAFNKLMLENLHNRTAEHIKEGKQKLELIIADDFKQLELEAQKHRQLYETTRKDRKQLFETDKRQYYEVVRLARRKNFGIEKFLGMFSLKSPKTTYKLDYIAPEKFRQHSRPSKSWKLTIPLDFSFSKGTIDLKSTKIPDISQIFIDFVVVTYQLDKHPIPFEFHHDFVNNQVKNQKDERASAYTDIQELEQIVDDTKRLSTELYNVFKKLGRENFAVEKSLVDDLKGICNIQTKENHLSIPNFTLPLSNGKQLTHRHINKLPWNKTNEGWSKLILVDLDLDSMQLKGYPYRLEKACDRFTLVPNFQLCYMGRMYYIRVLICLSTGQFIHLKLPVHVWKPWLENCV